MSRGWESKSVESQMQDAESKRAAGHAASLTEAQIAAQREREILQMSRTRVLKDLETATHPRYREQLQAALKHLEEKLKACASAAR